MGLATLTESLLLLQNFLIQAGDMILVVTAVRRAPMFGFRAANRTPHRLERAGQQQLSAQRAVGVNTDLGMAYMLSQTAGMKSVSTLRYLRVRNGLLADDANWWVILRDWRGLIDLRGLHGFFFLFISVSLLPGFFLARLCATGSVSIDLALSHLPFVFL